MKAFEKNIIGLYGEKGKLWLGTLESRVDQAVAAYGLLNLNPVKNLSYNYVLSGFQGAKPIILKVGLDSAGFKREAASLRAFSGFGAVQVLAQDEGLLLQMRAMPGASLKSHFPDNDDESISITANVIMRLHKAPIPHAHVFPHIKDWLAALDRHCEQSEAMQEKPGAPRSHVVRNDAFLLHLDKARFLRDHLLKTSKEEILLHGDLHHDNILQDGDTWVVIDPKGVIGEPSFEVAAFIRNPIPELLADAHAESIIKHRIALFAEILGLSECRILEWCFVQAVLCWVWALEDRGDDSYFKHLTQVFERMIDVRS